MSLLTGRYGFLHWWAVLVPTQIVEQGKQSIASVGDAFAMKAMLQHMGEPIFQDPTWQGRLIGIGIRIIRVGIGLFAEMLTFIAVGVVLLVWYLFPLIALGGIVL